MGSAEIGLSPRPREPRGLRPPPKLRIEEAPPEKRSGPPSGGQVAMFGKLSFAGLPDADTLGGVEPERIRLGHAVCRREFVDVAHDLIAAEFVRRVRIDRQEAQRL